MAYLLSSDGMPSDPRSGVSRLTQEDETTLPLAVQRRLNRERRQKQLERHTKEAIRKQKARERAAVFGELWKYLCMMCLYFFVVRHASRPALVAGGSA